MLHVATVSRPNMLLLVVLKMDGILLQERLKNQKEEAASNPEYGKTYKPKVSKADKQAKRKQILSNIGNSTTFRTCLFRKQAALLCFVTNLLSFCVTVVAFSPQHALHALHHQQYISVLGQTSLQEIDA